MLVEYSGGIFTALARSPPLAITLCASDVYQDPRLWYRISQIQGKSRV